MAWRRKAILGAALVIPSSLGWELRSGLTGKDVADLNRDTQSTRLVLESLGRQPSLDENWPGVPREVAAQIDSSSPLAVLLRGLSVGRSAAAGENSAFPSSAPPN
jgi:hypothetical protein